MALATTPADADADADADAQSEQPAEPKAYPTLLLVEPKQTQSEQMKPHSRVATRQ